MIASFADLCTVAYVLVDDLYRLLAPPPDRRPGPRAAFSDSEVITLTLVAELVGMDEETRFLAYLERQYRALFPRLPDASRYNRRRRQLCEVPNRIRAALMTGVLAQLTSEERALYVIDSVPVPVVGFHPARGRHQWSGRASYGYCAAKKQTIYGFKPHLLAPRPERLDRRLRLGPRASARQRLDRATAAQQSPPDRARG